MLAVGKCLFGKALRDSKGVTSLEYAVLGVFLVVAIIGAVGVLAGDISSALGTIGGSI